MPFLTWQPWLARPAVKDQPRPWQKTLTTLSPGRMRQSQVALFARIDSTSRGTQMPRKVRWPAGGQKVRIRYLHLKDVDPGVMAQVRAEGLDYFQATAAGVLCELGRGCVDFAAVTANMKGLGYDGWAAVEQDILAGMDAPLESAWRNRAYLQGLGL